LVAFFNAPVASTLAIGTDSNGMDWKTAGYWASMRKAWTGSDATYKISYVPVKVPTHFVALSSASKN
jgi:hypothetical protein